MPYSIPGRIGREEAAQACLQVLRYADKDRLAVDDVRQLEIYSLIAGEKRDMRPLSDGALLKIMQIYNNYHGV
jgi:hypothetical protein